MRRWIAFVVVAASLAASGCGGGKLPEAKDDKAQLPDGHPPVDGSATAPMGGALGSSGPTDDNPLPLKLTGLNSAEELTRDLAHTQNAEAREAFEVGYRRTFTADMAKRDYAGAVTDLERATTLDPRFAPAYRALGYAKFNMGFNVEGAMADYMKAVEIDPEYGEAHYALAFMYAMGDKAKGAEHFKKAMELGIPDERNLREKFYAGS
jgi:tetratricopeptide (TPR) repeat protein